MTKSSSLLRRLLLRRTIGLSRTKADTLLLCSHLLSLPVTRLKKIGQRRLIGEALLTSQIGLFNASAVATECASLNGLALHSRTSLRIFLRLQSLLCPHHVRQERVHILTVIERLRTNRLSASTHILLRRLIKRICGLQSSLRKLSRTLIERLSSLQRILHQLR